MPASRLPRRRADRLAAALCLDVGSARICLACLSFVSFALERGDRHEVQGQLMQVTENMWHEGLAEHALAAVRDGCDRGLRDATWALADLEEHGGRTPIARAIVLCLAKQLRQRARTESHLTAVARDRLARTWPELN